MTANEIKSAMEAVAKSKYDEFERKISELDSTAKTEQRALKISANIANICRQYPGYLDGEENLARREAVIKRETETMAKSMPELMSLADAMEKMSGEDKKLFLAYAYPAVSIRKTFIDSRPSLPHSKKMTEKEAVANFENKIIKSVASEIVKEWDKLWQENGFKADKVGEI